MVRALSLVRGDGKLTFSRLKLYGIHRLGEQRALGELLCIGRHQMRREYALRHAQSGQCQLGGRMRFGRDRDDSALLPAGKVTRRGRGAIVASIVAVASALTSATSMSAAEPGSANPVALTGRVAGASLDDAQFIVELWPRSDIEKKLVVGDNVPTHRLPEAAVTANGSNFAIRLSPQGVPSNFIDDDGRVHLDVVILGSDRIGGTSATVSLLTGDQPGDARWIDPMSPLASGDRSAPSDLADLDPQPKPVSVAVALEKQRPATTVAAANCPTIRKLEKKSDRVVAIGHTFVPSGTQSKAWAFHGGSRSHTLGVAANYGGSWKAEKSKTFESGDTFKWSANRSRTRSYRVETRYGKYYYQDLVKYPMESKCIKRRKWTPMYNTGGRFEKSYSSSPTWGSRANCRPYPSGEWTRTRTDGRNFSLAGGVAIKDLIGFDLSSKRAYSASSYIAYQIVGSGKKLCGNNDVPSRAGAIRMAKTW